MRLIINLFIHVCLLHVQGGRLVLPDVTVTDSSEALLSGRKPPFRLVARAKHADGRRLRIRHAVSEPFVVATRRVRASHKVTACSVARYMHCTSQAGVPAAV
jgi:hypothetical protein